MNTDTPKRGSAVPTTVVVVPSGCVVTTVPFGVFVWVDWRPVAEVVVRVSLPGTGLWYAKVVAAPRALVWVTAMAPGVTVDDQAVAPPAAFTWPVSRPEVSYP